MTHLDDYRVFVSRQTQEVLKLKEEHVITWRDKPQRRWMAGLVEEVLELLLALIGLHHHSPDQELAQIASICLNWREYRHSLMIDKLTKSIQ